MDNALVIILGGGRGTRLYPLTKERAKPAVPFGGKFRLVDISIANSINSGFKQIYILTQFESASLNSHISKTYQFDSFSGGFVEILAASQNFSNQDGWYNGTADAIRKNISKFEHDYKKPSYYIILSGDQLYKMDLEDFLDHHKATKADITIASTPVSREEASSLGILKTDENFRIKKFFEKPKENNIDEFKISDPSKNRDEYLASMGIYIFNRDVMEECLKTDYMDFGSEIIPQSLDTFKVNSYIYNGYWEDIGTIRNFYEANLNLASINPNFNIYDENNPVYYRSRNLPPSKLNSCTIRASLTCEGSIINDSFINYSVIGIRTIINEGASIDSTYCMGADYYETEERKEENKKEGLPDIGIGRGCIIKGAIIDKNAKIGNNCRIGIDDIYRVDGDYKNYSIVNGIIVIHKNSVLYDGTIL